MAACCESASAHVSSTRSCESEQAGADESAEIAEWPRISGREMTAASPEGAPMLRADALHKHDLGHLW